MKNRLPGTTAWILAAALLPALAACSGGSVTAHVENGHGTVNVFLTDAPLDLAGVKSVNVTLTSVVLYPEDSTATGSLQDMESTEPTPVVIVSHPATFDLLTLTGGAKALLGTDEVPAGGYARIRLEVSDAQLVAPDGTVTSLQIDARKVDVPIHFTVRADQTTGVVLDFDAAASVQVNGTGSGSFILRPVVTPQGTL
ncbi:MAG TPA: DUF4382 domain-containing protein [Thermoanaerobaculia bacterium]|nr:DUF4382 domain-containing protein [Thermoanaerobaculia bacterium]